MFGFIVSLLFGAAQMYVTIILIPEFTSGSRKKSMGILAAKFFAYLGAVALVTLKFLSVLTYCLCGFIVGVALSAIAFCVYKIFFTNK